MLDRYSSPAMRKIWATDSTYDRWRRVELAVVEARVVSGQTPESVLKALRRQPTPSADRVAAIEGEVRHDVVAFLYAWTEDMDPSVAAHVHRDLTSSDIVDTALSLAIRDATDLVLKAGVDLVIALCDCALAHRATVCVARTHGQAAAPSVFGHRIADLAFAADRAVNRLTAASGEAALVNITGPVGTGVGLKPGTANNVARILSLAVPPATTQVVFRDHVATWVFALTMLAAVCEAIATDVRIGQHDGVGELAERHTARQEGSSAMPHKVNPVTSERICGLARVMRGYVSPVMENVSLWQHRDISHSSVERVILPDASTVAEYVCRSAASLIVHLDVHTDTMIENVHRAGYDLASSRMLSGRLAEGLPRRDAVQQVRDERRPSAGTSDGVNPSPLTAAVDEMLASETLSECFDGVTRLRQLYREMQAVD